MAELPWICTGAVRPFFVVAAAIRYRLPILESEIQIRRYENRNSTARCSEGGERFPAGRGRKAAVSRFYHKNTISRGTVTV